jgi:hypothetical protein
MRGLLWAVLLVAWVSLEQLYGQHAFKGAKVAASDVKALAKSAGAILGGLVTLVAGGRAAWKAYRDEDWVGYGITAVVAAALAFIAGAALD